MDEKNKKNRKKASEGCAERILPLYEALQGSASQPD
jgi:hypothetical protein